MRLWWWGEDDLLDGLGLSGEAHQAWGGEHGRDEGLDLHGRWDEVELKCWSVGLEVVKLGYRAWSSVVEV